MTNKQQIKRELAEIIGTYSSGCVICKGQTDESRIDIYDLHWNCYKMIRLLIELEKAR